MGAGVGDQAGVTLDAVRIAVGGNDGFLRDCCASRSIDRGVSARSAPRELTGRQAAIDRQDMAR
jgi:hypothetical protein